MTQDFQTSLSFVLSAEGGFSNVPGDRGGPTDYGVTQATYSAWLLNHSLPDAPVSGISHEYIEAIYLEIWNAGGCDKLPSPLNAVHFDSMVQHGAAPATSMLSSACAFPGAAVEAEAFALLALRDNFYHRIVRVNPTQAKWLGGWINRLAHLRTFSGL